MRPWWMAAPSENEVGDLEEDHGSDRRHEGR
jgi:hypothetical protein